MPAASMPRFESSTVGIGELGRQTGLSASAIRYYEDVGLLDPPSRVGGKRQFTDAAVLRLRVVTTLQAAGFSLEEIRKLLQTDARSMATRRRLTQAKLDEVRHRIQDLRLAERALSQMLDCGCASLEHCPLAVDGAAQHLGGAHARHSTTARPSGGRRGQVQRQSSLWLTIEA